MYTFRSKYSAIIYIQQITVYDLWFYQWFRVGYVRLVLACSLLGSTVLHLDVVVGRSEVVQRSLWVSLDRLTTFGPAGGADLPMLFLWGWITNDSTYKIITRTVNWNACNRRMVSSTERPTGKSLIVICLEPCDEPH